MAKEEAAAAPQAPVLRVINQYTRDLSFENIAAQNSLGQVNPEVSVQVNLDAKKLTDDQYEVILKLNVSAKDGEQAVFMLEIDYAGMFEINNVPEEQMHPFLMIECPRLIFPFVRRIARDVTADGGFPPLNIDNIDFLALYRNELTRRAAEESKGAVKS